MSELRLELHEYLLGPRRDNIEFGLLILINLRMNHYCLVVNDNVLDPVGLLSVFLFLMILAVFSPNFQTKVLRKFYDVEND